MMKGMNGGANQAVEQDGSVDHENETVIVFLWDAEASSEEATGKLQQDSQHELPAGGSPQHKPATGELKYALEHYSAWLEARGGRSESI